MWHIRADLVDAELKVDQAALGAIAGMGGPMYSRTRDPFTMKIPDWRSVVPPGPPTS